jgi:hypothetical protein
LWGARLPRSVMASLFSRGRLQGSAIPFVSALATSGFMKHPISEIQSRVQVWAVRLVRDPMRNGRPGRHRLR